MTTISGTFFSLTKVALSFCAIFCAMVMLWVPASFAEFINEKIIEEERPDFRMNGDYLLFSGRVLSRHITVTNHGKQTHTVSVELRNARLLENGYYEWIASATSDEAQLSASPYLTLIPSKLILAPGQSKDVRLLLRPQAAIPDFEVHSYLTLISQPKQEQRTGSNMLPLIALQQQEGDLSGVIASAPVIIRPTPTDVSAEIAEVQFDKKSRQLQVKLRRLGSQSVFGKVRVRYFSATMDEGIIVHGEVFAPVIIPNRIRSLQIQCDTPVGVDFSKGKLVVEYTDIIDAKHQVLDMERVPL